MSIVKKVNSTGGRLFFVSDIHGEIDVLLKALFEVGFSFGEDTLVCAGDLIDRGSQSLKTLDWFLIKENSGSVHTVIGNHDLFAIENNHASNCDLWVMNGGTWAFQELLQEERDCYGIMLSELPVAIEVLHEGYTIGVTHASVPQEFTSWEDYKSALEDGNDDLVHETVWDRSFIEHHDYHKDNHLSGVFATVHGHTPVKNPAMVGNRFHIDTGLVYGKYLSLVEFDKGTFTVFKFNIDGRLYEKKR
ncbi:NinI-like serine-threonine phosphatase [Pseudoalteromonas phage H101]|uniref:Serine/threonine protein phosphatase n=1 Tax=Pseudoalteromonas phage H101 TaxID=1654919 RepID=A0A0H4IN85_9CAUD|nr:NinI-like serine-threonine phosphatase [Pseudoalteromonas phage H101]AKO61024.1 serine/threonine protein phosphatase [Pseudoalteromonas phage H101]